MGERGATEVIDGSGREGSDGGYRRQWVRGERRRLQTAVGERGATEVIDGSGREGSDGGYRRQWVRGERRRL